jgi:hypothetical protein
MSSSSQTHTSAIRQPSRIFNRRINRTREICLSARPHSHSTRAIFPQQPQILRQQIQRLDVRPSYSGTRILRKIRPNLLHECAEINLLLSYCAVLAGERVCAEDLRDLGGVVGASIGE